MSKRKEGAGKEEKVSITITIPKELEHSFRMEAYSLYGPKKGSLSKGAEDAIMDWLSKAGSEREAKAKEREEGKG